MHTLSAIRRRAWEILRQSYGYPRNSLADNGRRCVRRVIEIAAHEVVHGTAAERLEREAQAAAVRHDYCVSALSFQLGRYQFGSLSINHEAAHMRSVYRRAVEIAGGRGAQLIAAE